MVHTTQKNGVLRALSEILLRDKAKIIDANQRDMAAFPQMDAALNDRLKVDKKKIVGMTQSLCDVAEMADPEDTLLYSFQREDGLKIENRTVPFGTILIIYESRPDVTIEAAATAFKAGNRILLKGGKEARHTNLALTAMWHEALAEYNIATDYVEYLDLSREETQAIIRENSRNVDLIIPRGGENLIRFVKENTAIPLIVSGRGNNFLYIDAHCDFDMAIALILNGKNRLSVCNALDKVLINKDIPQIDVRLDELIKALKNNNLNVLGGESVCYLSEEIELHPEESVLYEEFLSENIYLTLVEDMSESITLINRYSGGHSAVIVTSDDSKARDFLHRVDCAAVYHNASTRFTDGGQFGVGAEIAISTQKLHFRGPIGAAQLVTNKWIIIGNGHTRR